MKMSLRILLFLCIAISFSSCKEEPPVFEMNLFFDLDIPAGLNTIESHFFIVEDVPTFAAALLSANNTNPEDIGSILGATGNVKTRFSGLNLDNIQDVGVHVLDQNDHTKRSEAFYIFNDLIPLGAKTEIQMIPSIVDLQDLLLQETVDLEFRVNLRSFLPQELDARIEMKFIAYKPE